MLFVFSHYTLQQSNHINENWKKNRIVHSVWCWILSNKFMTCNESQKMHLNQCFFQPKCCWKWHQTKWNWIYSNQMLSSSILSIDACLQSFFARQMKNVNIFIIQFNQNFSKYSLEQKLSEFFAFISILFEFLRFSENVSRNKRTNKSAIGMKYYFIETSMCFGNK